MSVPFAYARSPSTLANCPRSDTGIAFQWNSRRSNASGLYQSSESMTAQKAPSARSAARLRATCLPLLACWIERTTTRPSCCQRPSCAAVSSVEPSSTTSHSKSLKVCSHRLAYRRPSRWARLNVGVTTVMTGRKRTSQILALWRTRNSGRSRQPIPIYGGPSHGGADEAIEGFLSMSFGIRVKLFAGFGAVLFLFAVVAGCGLVKLGESDDSVGVLGAREMPSLQAAMNSQVAVVSVQRDLHQAVLVNDDAARAKSKASYEASDKQFAASVAELGKLLVTPEGKASLAEVTKAYADWAPTRTKALDLALKGDAKGAEEAL